MTLQVMGTAVCAAEPTMVKMQNQKIKAEVPVYIKESWFDFSTGQTREIQAHFRCVFFGEGARRAQSMIMKGTQIIITGAKLRVVKNPKNNRVSYTQIWVEKWELPAKVMMTKKLYQEVYQTDISPIKVSLSSLHNRVSILVMLDCHQMNSRFPAFEKKDLKLLIKLKTKSSVEPCRLTEKYSKYSTNQIKIYEYLSSEMEKRDVSLINEVSINAFLDNDNVYEITFPINECICQENKK